MAGNLDDLDGYVLLRAIADLATIDRAATLDKRRLAGPAPARVARRPRKPKPPRREAGIYTEQWPKLPPGMPSRWRPKRPCRHCKPGHPCLAHAKW